MSALFQPDQQPKRGRIQRVRKELLTSVVNWFRSNGREFPWRETVNPFHVLIAEVLLRQTQSARVVDTYTHLVAAYPSPASLAEASVDGLRKWFKPLGLVQRADRLIKCAHRLVEDYEGQVPRILADLQSLPGIGRYSARAILCMAFNHPLPMIDEGSGRVLRRVLGHSHTGAAYSDVRLAAHWERFRPGNHAREFNLGLIDIGAAHCHSQKPACRSCPILAFCAYGSGLAGSIA